MYYLTTKFRRMKFDMVIDNINGVPFFTPLYIRKPKIAIIHHLVKNIFFKELPFYLAIIGWICERLMPIIYFNTLIITVSQSSKQELEKFGFRNVQIVPNGLNAYDGKMSFTKNNVPTVIYLGRIKKYKRVDHLLRAFKIVQNRISNAELWIVGDGDAKPELEKLVQKLTLKNVKFFGYVEERKKIELLSKSWVFVITSEKEGWGNTILEANSCGTPAIGYNVAGVKDAIKNGYNGLLVRNNDVYVLANKIIEILQHNELRMQLSKNAIEYSRRFSWEYSARLLESIIISIISNKVKRGENYVEHSYPSIQ